MNGPGKPGGQYVVVLVTGSECDEYPGTMCVMDVLGPYRRDEVYAVAARSPEWTRPHVMHLRKDDDL